MRLAIFRNWLSATARACSCTPTEADKHFYTSSKITARRWPSSTYRTPDQSGKPDAKSTYDFVQYLGKSLVLIRYRDGSGYAALNVGKNKQPVLTAMSELPNSTSVQNIDQHTFLFASTSSAGKTLPTIRLK